MLKELRTKEKVTGVKQSGRAIRSGAARQVFLAYDADPALTAPLLELCRQQGVPAAIRYSMEELGQAAGIQVGATVVALLE